MDNISNDIDVKKDKELEKSCLQIEEEQNGYTMQCGKITVHVRYADTERTLVDNLNQYFSRL